MNTKSTNDWLQTFTGKKLYPLAPTPDAICIEDIAHALANQCRFNGHTKKFYSVAQHSVLITDYFFDPDLGDFADLAQYALLHDASEAYLSDIPRPLKLLPEFEFYRQAEKKLQSMIYEKFGLSPEEPAEVKEADQRILAEESLWLMAPLHPDWVMDFSEVQYSYLQHEVWSPEKSEERFLGMFWTLFGTEEQRKAQFETELKNFTVGL